MVRRLGLGKNNHLTYASLALNPRYCSSMVLLLQVNCSNASGAIAMLWLLLLFPQTLLFLSCMFASFPYAPGITPLLSPSWSKATFWNVWYCSLIIVCRQQQVKPIDSTTCGLLHGGEKASQSVTQIAESILHYSTTPEESVVQYSFCNRQITVWKWFHKPCP